MPREKPDPILDRAFAEAMRGVPMPQPVTPDDLAERLAEQEPDHAD